MKNKQEKVLDNMDNKINIVTVVFKDNKELVICATTDSEKATKAMGVIIRSISELSEEKVSDFTSTTTQEFDDEYEEFLFNKELADNFLSIKITQVPLNSIFNQKL